MTRTQKKRDLTPEAARSAKFLNDLILSWRQEDSINRGRAPLTQIAKGISGFYQNKEHKITAPGLSMWLTGDNIPNKESAQAIAHFFNVDIEKTFAALGHVYSPPVSFVTFYETVSCVSAEEKWVDRNDIILQLGLITDVDITTNESWMIQIAYSILKNPQLDIHEKAQQIAHLVSAKEYLAKTDFPLLKRKNG